MEEEKWEALRTPPGERAAYDVAALLADMRADLLTAIERVRQETAVLERRLHAVLKRNSK